MKKETFQILFKNQQIIREIQCEYIFLKKQVSKYVNEIPFDCLILIDENQKVYSATDSVSQQSKSFTVHNLRDIISDNQQRQQQELLSTSQIANKEIQQLKVKLYDYDQVIQKKEKIIKELEIELQKSQDEIQQQKINQNKQETTYHLLINEKIYQIQKLDQEKYDQEQMYKNEIENLNQLIQDQQMNLEQLKSNNKQEIETIKSQNNKKIKELEEELSKLQVQLLYKEQEIKSLEYLIKNTENDQAVLQLQQVGFKMIKEQLQHVNYENVELKRKIEFLTQKLNALEQSNSKDQQQQ